MQKLIKNWVVTMITAILLITLSTLMFLDGFEVVDFGFDRLIHLLAAIALVIYVAFAVLPLTWRYRGAIQGFAIGEVLILLLTALAQFCNEWFSVPLISELGVCAVFGLALWLRGVVETVHAYFSNASEDPKKRIPLWRLLIYILLSAVGVWQLVRPSIENKHFIFLIATVSAVMGLIFISLTAYNRKLTAPQRAARKEQKAKEKAARLEAEAKEAQAKKEAEAKKAEEAKKAAEAKKAEEAAKVAEQKKEAQLLDAKKESAKKEAESAERKTEASQSQESKG